MEKADSMPSFPELPFVPTWLLVLLLLQAHILEEREAPYVQEER